MDKQPGISKEAFEEIEGYLLGLMDNDTRLKFESRMANDPELAHEVSLQQKLFASIETGSFSSIPQQSKYVGISRRYFTWLAGAAALLIFAVITLWFVQRSARSTESLYAAYYQPDPGLPVEMGAADSVAYLFYDGMISYKEGDYELALKKWQKLSGTAVRNDTLQYYMSMAQLNSGATNESINTLKVLANKPGAAYYQEANWYLALAYLKKDDVKAAQERLKKIPDYPGARSLLKKL